MPSRRGFLRRVGAVAGLGLLTTTAGCGGLRFAEAEGGGTSSLSTPELDAAAFEAYLGRTRTAWGDHGVFGRLDPPEAEFVTAWSLSFSVGPEDAGYAAADFAVARYFLGESDAGDRLDAWVVWGAARPPTDRVDNTGIPGDPSLSPSVRGLGAHLSVDGPAELVHYDPEGVFDADEVDGYRALSGVPSDESVSVVSAVVPLEAGVVRGGTAPDTWVNPPETGFDADAYTVGWEGRNDDAVSVTAVCTTRMPADADPTAADPRLDYHVAAAGYL